ncbi:60S ribosomal protein L8 [Mucor velutinosus]|uniref:60S ribosomal protein L8 n=1 Tax=Mucor velutinosus TaxID=708070 RepID=A0AAN7DA10_9FUNG|nr:60S ribosomal protein L8 [Mucor velutinosus]
MADVLSPTPSPPTSPSPMPPRRPNKSRLRTLSAMDQISTHSSNQSTHSLSPSETSSIPPNSSNSDASLFLSAPPPPLKSNYRSRFTEHFDKQPKRPDTLKASKSLTTIASLPKSSKLTRSSSSSSGSDFMFDAQSDKQRIQLTSSTSTPLQLPHPPRKYGSNGSVLTTNTKSTSQTTTTSHHPAPNNASLNRADFIISRLETWHQCLKSVTSWVEEVAKISLVSSRGFSQKAYPHVDQSLPDNVNASIRTIQAGFRALTMQMAAEQQAFSKCLERDHLPTLFKLRRQVKDRVQQLKNDPTLVLDELLRRAEVTRSKMTHLNRCCKQADKLSGQQVEMDPWVANLLVLRQLKREVDEENRLRLLMIPIQKETADLEQQVIQQIKPTIRYCYEVLSPSAWDGSEDKETAPFELMMDQIMPQQSWDQFVQENKSNFVNEKNPTKDYLKINYPNKFHPLVMTLLKGKMERKFGVRKQFIERNYVLSQGGYLHQFSLDDKVTPEKTIYIPNTTIVPSIDLSKLHTVLTEYAGDTSNTFEICKPSTNVLQRDKISVFRTSTREELVTWCRLLVHIASGVSLSSLDEDLVLRNSSSSFDELEQHPVHMMRLSHSQNMDTRKISIGGTSVGALSSPARSLRSVRTEESFNEPAAYSKSSTPLPTTTTFNVSTPISGVIVEEEMYSTDAESFVTATPQMEDDDDNLYYHSDEEEGDAEQDASALMDYFSPQHGHQPSEDDDDAASIASNSTAKGHSATAHSPNEANERSPSLHSTSDAQSSLYFSSASAPPSPSGLSDTSSIVSIPEFELVPQAINVHHHQQGETESV